MADSIPAITSQGRADHEEVLFQKLLGGPVHGHPSLPALLHSLILKADQLRHQSNTSSDLTSWLTGAGDGVGGVDTPEECLGRPAGRERP